MLPTKSYPGASETSLMLSFVALWSRGATSETGWLPMRKTSKHSCILCGFLRCRCDDIEDSRECDEPGCGFVCRCPRDPDDTA